MGIAHSVPGGCTGADGRVKYASMAFYRDWIHAHVHTPFYKASSQEPEIWIDLIKGWNLVSLQNQFNIAIANLKDISRFQSASDQAAIQAIWQWDASNQSWKVDTEAPKGDIPSLEKVDTSGVWIKTSRAIRYRI